MDTPAFHIRNARIVKPHDIVTGDLVLENGVIAYAGGPLDDEDGHVVIDASGLYVMPGFIDLHVHGGCGFDATMGMYNAAADSFDSSPEAFARGIRAALRSMADAGTTTALLATLAAADESLAIGLRELGAYANGPANGRDGTRLAGLFVEGTFIKRPEFSGAQNPRYFKAPSVDAFEQLNRLAAGAIKYVNVVPEHGAQALELMKHLRGAGIVVGAGHTECSAAQYLEAVDHGLRVAIHFTNGPTGSSLKPFGGGGVLQAVLRSHKVYAELILDGYHVNPHYVRDIISRKTHDRVIGVTDAMFAVDAEGIDSFSMRGVAGQLSGNGEYLRVVDKENTLFGSVLKLRQAFSNLVSWYTRPMPGIWQDAHPPLGLHDAILTASKMLSENPARALALYEPTCRWLNQDLSGYTGSLEVGKRADVVAMRLVGSAGDYATEIEHVFVGGAKVE